jgi:hypothetical protein
VKEVVLVLHNFLVDFQVLYINTYLELSFYSIENIQIVDK